ncbi:MAG: putative hydroxymethylpyrimidine transporter CytX [Thermoleophilia bacterium]|nr:putative hydroxymethylpyrimidine transporter CytX [Thermoleophilia bacterium]
MAIADETAGWGIEPVPDRLRRLGLVDTALLWGNLGVSLLVIVAGALLVPALSLRDALVACLVGALLGNAMLAVAGMIGADARVPSMVVLRAPLGQRGSWAPTALNVLQCLGWSVFELIVIATAAAALSDSLLGFEARWLWTLVFGALAISLGLLGPVGVVRRVLRKYAVWIVLASLAYLSWWALDGVDLGAAWDAPGEGGLSTWQGIDLVVGITVSWIPLAADYTRFSTGRRAGLLGTGVGYFVSSAWMLVLGVLLLLGRDITDAASLPAAVAAAGVASALALLAVTVDETDEAFANVYSTAVSLQNLLPAAPQRLLVAGAGVVATIGALLLEISDYEPFLYLLGSFFVPLFAVLVADWLLAGMRYRRSHVFESPPVRGGLLLAWLAGFVVYQWLHPSGPDWWLDAVARLDPPSWTIGATLPSFALSFALAAAAAALGGRRF